jgi:uncharacterized protein (DUF1501 family)
MLYANQTEFSRRNFMKRGAQAAALTGVASYATGLTAIGEAAAFSAGNDDYKALVCVFLKGGNDHSNTLIPFDATNYARYSALRGGDGEGGGGLALPRASLAQTVLQPAEGQTLTDDQLFALSPAMTRLSGLYRQGAMAPLLNIGPLLAPLTLEQYKSRNHKANPRPAKLFSHNDQQSTWQSGLPEGAPTGWGGRIGDLARNSNANPVFTSITASSNEVFLAGRGTTAYAVSSNGAVELRPVTRGLYRSPEAGNAMRQLLTGTREHVLEADYTRIARRSLDAQGFIDDALSSANLATSFDDPSGRNGLANELRIVARLIAARQSLGVKRQVFIVTTGGFDNHDDLIDKHEGLLSKLDFALDAFYRATVELGVANQVTSFTASDFGRTLTSNGDGSDHGWGSHHFVVGGSVAGAQFYGTAPHMSDETDDQVGRGRLLPSMAVDQMASTLALWFGVAPSELSTVLPNIGRFPSADLGFLRAA